MEGESLPLNPGSIAERIVSGVWTEATRFGLVATSPKRTLRTGRTRLEDRPARLAAFEAEAAGIVDGLASGTLDEVGARERASALGSLSVCVSRTEMVERVEEALRQSANAWTDHGESVVAYLKLWSDPSHRLSP